MKDYDLKGALGTPEKSGKGKKASYLDGKSPELVSHLLEAVDGDEARAEALCRALEAFSNESEAAEAPEEESELPPLPGDDMGMF
jgi:hypothetical protein